MPEEHDDPKPLMFYATTGNLMSQGVSLGIENIYQLVLDMTMEGVIIGNLEGKLEYVNSKMALMLGYSVEEMIGNNILDFTFGDSRAKIKKIREQSMNQGISNGESKLRKKDGSAFWSIFSIQPLFNMKNEHVANLIIHTDITKQKELEHALSKYQKNLEAKIQNRTTKLTEMNMKLRSISAYNIGLIEKEKERLSRELHDQIGQSLVYAKIMTERINSTGNEKNELLIQEILKVNNELIKRVNAISFEMHPKILDQLGLSEALSWYCDEFTTRTGIRHKFQSELSETFTDNEINLCLFRIAQEAFANIARHSNATLASVRLEEHESWVILEINDNGIGFDAKKIAVAESRGIDGMEERVRILNGTLKISSKLTQGVKVVAKIPLNKKGN